MSVYYIGSVQALPQENKLEVENFIRGGIPVFTETGMEKCSAVTLGTRQGDGVRLTVINLLEGSCLGEIFMQCNRNSQKAKNLLNYNEAEVAITDGMGYVVLECIGEVLNGDAIETEKWEDWMSEFHPQGAASPDYVILRLVPQGIRAIL